MLSLLVVVRKPLWQMAVALVECLLDSCVGSFVYQRLYEALDLAVGLRPVVSGAEMAKIEPLADIPEDFRSVAGTVVGHDLVDGARVSGSAQSPTSGRALRFHPSRPSTPRHTPVASGR